MNEELCRPELLATKEKQLKEAKEDWLRDAIKNCKKCGHSGVLFVGEPIEDGSKWFKVTVEELEEELGKRHPN